MDNGHLSYYKNHEEKSPRYILTLKNCAVRDEGSKPNKRHIAKKSSSAVAPTSTTLPNSSSNGSLDSNEKAEAGSRFYVFSIYQRFNTKKNDGYIYNENATGTGGPANAGSTSGQRIESVKSNI